MPKFLALVFVATVHQVADGVCPDSGLFFQEACWYLSEKSTTCAATCYAHGLSFAWRLGLEHIVPKLLGYVPRRTEPAWGRLECYVESSDQHFTAQLIPDPSSGDSTDNPEHWGASECRIACPCGVLSESPTDVSDHAVSSTTNIAFSERSLGICALPPHQLAICCLQVPQQCWRNGLQGYNLLRSYRECCLVASSSGCPFFADVLSLNTLNSDNENGDRSVDLEQIGQIEVCVHTEAISHDLVEARVRATRQPFECHLLQMIIKFLKSKVRRKLRVVDIGAHIGDCASALAAQGADVFAFEPHPRTYVMLNATASRLRTRKDEYLRALHLAKSAPNTMTEPGSLIALNLAIADGHRLSQLLEPVGNSGGSATLPAFARPPRHNDLRAWPVEEQTLDTFLASLKIQHVDILKIDAEGDENRVFRGSIALMTDPIRRPRYVKFEFYPARLSRRREDPTVLLVSLIVCGYGLLVLNKDSADDLRGSCWIWDINAVKRVVIAFDHERATDILAVASNEVSEVKETFVSSMGIYQGRSEPVRIGLC